MRQWALTATAGFTAKLFPLVISWVVLSSSWKAEGHIGRLSKIPTSSSGSFFFFASWKLSEASEFQEAAEQTLTSLLCPKPPLQPQASSDSSGRTQFNRFPVALAGDFAKPTSFKAELRIFLPKMLSCSSSAKWIDFSRQSSMGENTLDSSIVNPAATAHGTPER